MRQRRQPDHGCRVPGQHKAISAKVAIARRAGRTQADPERETAEKRQRILRKQGHQQHHHRRSGQRPQQAIKTLGEHLSALRLHDDEHSDHRRMRLWQFQAQCQPVGEECGEQHLEDVNPGHPVTARPTVQLATPRQVGDALQSGDHCPPPDSAAVCAE